MGERPEVPAGQSWSAGIVHHGALDDLEACLRSIAVQTRPPRAVAVWDTGVDPEALARLAVRHPEVRFEGGTNEGYAGGANRVIASLTGGSTPPDFVLLLNPDVILDADFAERLLEEIARRPAVAVASGKLLRPDRRTLDSAGIVFPRHRRPRDRGSEAIDEGQYDAAVDVDAASGAAMMLRCAALADLAIEGELFDESFFAYHEDTDLSWRARRFGHRVRYVPTAVAVHARGWRKDDRGRVPVHVRRHSFKNHYLQLVKNETRADFLRNAPAILAWEILRLGFTLLRDPRLLPAYAEAARLLPEAWRKRRVIAERARLSPEERVVHVSAERACEAPEGR